jgi:NodT family efflux transporter outer membrane factor (OMF) lipoprotein
MACSTTGQSYKTPTVPLPETFRNSDVVFNSTRSEVFGKQAWWFQYGSAELNKLIEQALVTNPDLRIANLHIDQAKIRASQAKAGGLPTLTAPMQIAAQGSGGTVNTQQSSQLGLQGTYRLDIWGEQRATEESAELQVARAEFARDEVQRNLVGGLVTTYIGYLSAQDSMTLAGENEVVTADILRLVEQRLALGDATSDELEQQRAALALQQATKASMENQLEDAKTALAKLVGVLVADLPLLVGQGLDALTLPSVEVDVPSALLLQRPDIRMVEARMRAANADINIARARLLPPIDLTAQAGYSGMALAQLIQPQSMFWTSVVSLAAVIFDGGRRQGDKDFAESVHEEMVETYRQIIYQSIREVESAVASLRLTRARLGAQTRSTRSALASFKIATDAYELGAADLPALLQARKNYQRSEDESQRTKAELLRAFASLSLALGADATEPHEPKH